MPGFTTPLSIKYPTADDYVKHEGFQSKLASDMQTLAETTDVGIQIASNKTAAEAKEDANQRIGALRREVKADLNETTRDLHASHVAMDADGVPYFRPGSITVKVLQDTDGTPYYS